MKKTKSVLETLSAQDIEEITKKAARNKNVPLIKSSQINMRLDSEDLNRAQTLAKLQGLPYTTFLTQLIREDVGRLWNIYKRAKKESLQIRKKTA
jgi:predicted DNA binding CopG/RHH family protein